MLTPLVLLLEYNRGAINIPKFHYFKAFFIANTCKNYIKTLKKIEEMTDFKTQFKIEFLPPGTGFPIDIW